MNNNKEKFEDTLARLEEIIARLETGSMPLEDMVDLVEQGAKLIKNCRSRLEVMNNKVEILFKDDGEAGEFTEFDPATDRAKAAGTVEQAPAAAPPKRKKAAQETPPQDDLPF